MGAPVLVLGTHRSGTSLVNRLLESGGLFVGKDLEENHESKAFIGLNRAVFRQASAKWSEPLRVEELLNDPLAKEMFVDYFDRALRSPRMRGYLGNLAYLRHRDPRYLNIDWGWKDPRTSITLPLWLELFPDARLLRVRRHGVDVAASLHTRYQRRRAAVEAAFRKGPRRGRPDLPFSGVDTLDGAFRLWQEGEEVLDRHLAGRDVHTFRYEDLLADPRTVMDAATAAIGLAPVPAASLDTIRSDRRLAYESDPALAALAKHHAKVLAAHGY